MKEEPWIRMPITAMQDNRLTPSDCLILAVIIDKSDATSCKLSYKDISQTANQSEMNCKRAVERLEKCGYIQVTRKKGEINEYQQCILAPKKRTKNIKASEENEVLERNNSDTISEMVELQRQELLKWQPKSNLTKPTEQEKKEIISESDNTDYGKIYDLMLQGKKFTDAFEEVTKKC